MSIKTRLFARLLFSKEERQILHRARKTSARGKRILYGINIPIGAVLVVMLLGALAYAVVYYNTQLNMTFKLQSQFGLKVEDASNVELTSIAWGEFAYGETKTASIDHLRNTSTEPIIVRYSVSLSDASWSVHIILMPSLIEWQPSDAQNIGYGSTLEIQIRLTAPASGQSLPQSGSITFSIVDA